MGKTLSGALNPNWRGGRSIASNGYVLIRARYRHTHWIASRLEYGRIRIFDINGACVGWMWLSEWEGQLAPWLLQQVVPRNDGTWTITHRLEISVPITKRSRNA